MTVSISAGWPKVWTSMIALVRLVMAFSMAFGSMHQKSGSMSTKTSFASVYFTE